MSTNTTIIPFLKFDQIRVQQCRCAIGVLVKYPICTYYINVISIYLRKGIYPEHGYATKTQGLWVVNYKDKKQERIATQLIKHRIDIFIDIPNSKNT